MMGKQGDWEKVARRSNLGPRHDIETLEGEYFFRPRKYSIDGEAEIQSASGQIRAGMPPKLMARLMDISDEKLTPKQVVAMLEPEERAQLVEVATKSDAAEAVHVRRLMLLHGIGDHNLDGTDNTGADDDFVTRLLEYPNVTNEMLGVIKEWNAPLVKTTPPISETSPDGSTREVTEDTPQVTDTSSVSDT